MTKGKKVISKHTPEHLKKEVSGLISVILKCDTECSNCDEIIEKLYDLLGELGDCTDVIPATDIGKVNDFFDDKELPLKNSTYGILAQKLRPILKKHINV
jgi:hypothetical protein